MFFYWTKWWLIIMKFNTQPIPQKIHFIWVGGSIPPQYLRTIQKVTEVAKRDGYEVNLWVDDPKNYHKTAAKEDINVPDLKIREIKNELFQPMKNDPFYKGTDPNFPQPKDTAPGERAKLFQKCVERELIGFKNLAAAADFLRYEILRKEGGWYFDTDTYFPELMPPSAPPFPEDLDTKNIEPVTQQAISQYVSKYRAYLNKLNHYNTTHLPVPPLPPDKRLKNFINDNPTPTEHLNSFQFSFKSKSYQMLQKLFKECLANTQNYLSREEQKSDENQPHFSNNQIPQLGLKANITGIKISYDDSDNVKKITYGGEDTINDVIGAVADNHIIKEIIVDCINQYEEADNNSQNQTDMDRKRYPYATGFDARKVFTIGYSGPGALTRGIQKIWEQTQTQISKEEQSPQARGEILINTFSSLMLSTLDNPRVAHAAGIEVITECDNTWLKKNKGKQFSFDTNSITSTTFFTKENPTTKEKEDLDESSEHSHKKTL